MTAAALCLALLAFVHAASENGQAILSPGSFGRIGIDAKVTGDLVDAAFRAETVSLQSRTFNERQASLTPQEVAELSADPASLARLIDGNRRMAPQKERQEYPRIPPDLQALAHLSYAADPLNIRTLRTIALGITLHVDAEKSRQLLQIASNLSKRDELVNLWLAQDYGKRGEVSLMLASFDHALRTSRKARDTAMPPLVSLLGSTDSHTVVGDLLRQQPEWERAFWGEFVRNPVTLANVLSFFENSGLSLSRVPEHNRQVLYSNLRAAGQYDALFSLSSQFRNQGDSNEPRGRFVAANASNPLAWTLRTRGDFAAHIDDSTGELQIDARAGSFGVAADKIVRGNRDFQISLRMAQQVDDSASLRLTATCVDGSRRRTLSRGVLGAGQDNLIIIVQAQECNFIALELAFEVREGRRNPLLRIASLNFDVL